MKAKIIWKRVSNAILNLEKFVKANPQNPHTRELLSSIATHQWQVTREILAEGIRADWKPSDLNLRALCWQLFGGAMTTKQSLESCFNSLKDHGRESKANKMAPQTRFSYAALNPFCASGGIRTVVTEFQDYVALATSASQLQAVSSLPIFTGARSSKLPSECPTKRELQDRTIKKGKT